MKSVLAIIFFIIFGNPAIAQLLPGQTDVNQSKKEITDKKGSYYFGFAGKAANLIDTWGFEFGLNAGGMLTNHFGIGIGVYSLVSHNVDIKLPGNQQKIPFLRLTYGGIELSYDIDVVKSFNVSAASMVGLGNISYSEYTGIDVQSDPGGGWLFLAEPGIGLNYELLRNTWVGLSINYRISLGVSYINLTNSDISGMVISLTVKNFSL